MDNNPQGEVFSGAMVTVDGHEIWLMFSDQIPEDVIGVVRIKWNVEQRRPEIVASVWLKESSDAQEVRVE